MYDFPFFGAGEAEYFERAELQIVFINEPKENEKKEIFAKVPPPLYDEDWEGRFYSVSSDQFVHAAIAEYYGNSKDEITRRADVDGEDRWFFAPDALVNLFNEDIERWLKEVHAISPILMVLRTEDWEAGGTVLSEWHDWSVTQLERVIKAFDHTINNSLYGSLEDYILQEIYDFFDGTLDAKYERYFNPGEDEVKSFWEGDIESLRKSLSMPDDYCEKTINGLISKLDVYNSEQRKLMVSHRELLYQFKEKLSEEHFNSLQNQIWICSFFEDSPDKLDHLPHTNELASELIYISWNLIQEGKIAECIPLYDKIMVCGTQDLSAYCNALYVAQADNNGLPVNAELNKRFIELALPHAPKNPAIFYNAAALHVEMKNYNEAVELIKKTVEYGYDNIEGIKNDLLNEPMFKEFVEQTKVIDVFLNS